MVTDPATPTSVPFPRAGDEATPGAAQTAATPDALIDRVVQGAHHAVDRLADRASPAVHSLQTVAADLSDLHEQWLATCRQHVREHPMMSLLTALSAGLLIGRLMSTR